MLRAVRRRITSLHGTLPLPRGVSFLGIALLFLLTGCVSAPPPDDLTPPTLPTAADQVPADVECLSDIPYGRASGHTLLLDIARPKHPPPGRMPAILYIHGGSFLNGTRKVTMNFPLAAQGYFTVSIDHRFATEAQWPAQLNDCKAAVRWLRANADKYHLDPKRIGVWGHSTGGQLAAMVGLTGDNPSREGDSGNPGFSSRVSCVVDLAGTTDLLAIAHQHTVDDVTSAQGYPALLLGAIPQDAPERARAASPVYCVRRGAPPFLILHGEADDVVPIAQSEALLTALQKAGVPATLTRLPGLGHAPRGYQEAPVTKQIIAFFDAQLRSNASGSMNDRAGQ